MQRNEGTGRTILIGIAVTVVGTIIATLALRLPVLRQKSPRPDLPRFSATINDGPDCDALQDFLGDNLGKLVEIKADVSSSLSTVYDDGDHQSLALRSLPTEGGTVVTRGCRDDVYVHVKGSASHIHFYHSGHNRFFGYYAIGPTIEMRQGRNFVLRSVAPEEVLLRTQLVTTASP